MGQQSEAWVMLLAVVGAIAAGLVNSGNHVVAFLSVLVAAGSYAYCHSPLAVNPPGWRTPAFAAALVTIVGSVAAALADANLPFLPPGVTRIAALVVAGVTSSGYTIWRYRLKHTATQA